MPNGTDSARADLPDPQSKNRVEGTSRPQM
jgi:hypothetical protein